MTMQQDSVRTDPLDDPRLAMLRHDHAEARERERVARREVQETRRMLRALRLDAPSPDIADATSRYHDAVSRHKEAVEDVARTQRDRHAYQRGINTKKWYVPRRSPQQ